MASVHSTNTKKIYSLARTGGYASIGGAATMIAGAALWGASGADLWQALDTGGMAAYLAAAGATKGQLAANLSLFVRGEMLICTRTHNRFRNPPGTG